MAAFPYEQHIFGGGSHPSVEITFSSSILIGSPALQQILGSVQVHDMTTKEPLLLIASGDDFVVLLAEKSQAKPLFVNKKLIASVHYR